MKKLLITAAALSTLSTAYASKARILALGDEVEDNYFVQDSRRIFTNASYVNNYADTVMIEWGEAEGNSGNDSDSKPKAMGGFLKKSGSMVYGAYLGNESNISNALRIVATDVTKTTGKTLKFTDNQLDLFVGGKASGWNWGADLIYSKTSDEQTANAKQEDNALALKVGVNNERTEAYVNLSLGSESTAKTGYNLGNGAITEDQKFEGKLGIQVGGATTLANDLHVFGTMKKFDWDQGVTTKREGGFVKYIAGVGKTYKQDGGMAFVRLYGQKLSIEIEGANLAKAELNHTVVPVVIGFEKAATSWLTFRGSISHNVIGEVEGKNLDKHLASSGTAVDTAHEAVADNYDALNGNVDGSGSATYLEGKRTIADSTTVSAGASLVFGKLVIDGFIGTTGSARNSTSQNKHGVLSGDNLLTRVGMTYSF